MRRAAFLDRDGVLNRALIRDGRPYSPSGLHEIEIPSGVPEACEQLRRHGLLLVMVTNQPEVARGRVIRQSVEEINDFLRSQIRIDDVRVCYHDDPDGCDCRKPKPGMLLAAARDLHIDLARSFVVGDRWRDIEAGRRAGCKTVLIDHRYAEPRPTGMDFVTHSLPSAVDWILKSAVIQPIQPES
jgi:D-glycero-D-manno-heptose 1,7-bisphosphate phosphatase